MTILFGFLKTLFKNMQNFKSVKWLCHFKLNIIVIFLIKITIADKGPNLRPSFLGNGDLSRFSIPEDTPVGSVVYRLKGSDPENGELTYSISGEYLRVNKKTGDLTLIKQLDRETEASIDVIISLTDDGQGGEPETISVRREILITDVNDNRPNFHKRPYSFKVSEKAAVGSTVFSEIVITDDDFGHNAQISLTCAVDESPIACKMFSVSAEEIGDGNYVGIITLAAPLDYETHSSYAMTLRANDGDNIATALIAITVLDVQDQSPKFIGGPYVFRVKENSVPGTRVGFISVQDGDTGNPRDVHLRLIDEAQNNYFRLSDIKRDTFTGTFSAIVETSDNILNAENDFVRENLGVYELSLEAREYPLNPDDIEPTLITRIGLAILIEDVDDHLPHFIPSIFPRILRIPYNPQESWTFPDFNVQIEDNDVEFSNSQFSLQFDWSLETPVPPDQVFSFVTPTGPNSIVQSKAIITLEVLNISLLQPGSAFDLEIGAYQNGHLVSKLNVPVEVNSMPKIRPIFNNTVYRVAVPEDIAEGDLITRIAAKNHEDFQDIKYNLIGVGTERFDVDEKTGHIRCGIANCLDFEKERHHFFLVKAKGGTGVEDEVFALFYVDVLERNDNKPEFQNSLPEFASSMRRSVPDGTTEFDPPFFIKAIDADFNDHITYIVTDHSMNTSGIYIDSQTGKLLLKKPLKWTETGEHKLTVTATDKTGKSNSQSVLLIVQAVPNIPPNFSFTTQAIEIPETLEVGKEIFKAVAHDPDGQDAALKYYIHSQPEPDLFIIEESTGWVRLNGKLDFEKKQTLYTIQLRVQDEGKPSEMAVTSLEITCLDVNDENPKFSSKNYVVDISESSKGDYPVITLKAKDDDANSSLIYDIHCPCQVWDSSGSMGSSDIAEKYFQHLKLNNITGEITLIASYEHKLSSVLEFQASVEDTFGFKPQNDDATVTLYVMAAERINPYFGDPWTPTNPWINLTIPESESEDVGRNVVTLNAWDYVADEEIKSFALVEDDADPFGLNGNVLQVISPLDYETRKHYIVRVKATDARGGTSIANLEIKLSDLNDHPPVFSRNEYKGKIAENSVFPTPILTVEASDRDDPENYGAIRYALSGPQSHLFMIDELAGVVQVAQGADIDREKDSSHTLYVLAKDTPGGGPFQRTATATVKITVEDENDVDPICHVIGGELFVGETAPVGTPIGNVTCFDPDETSKSKLQFHIRDEAHLGLFGVDLQTGALNVAKSLRGRGRSAPYTISLVTQDGKDRSVVTLVPIKVANLIPNDGKPHFTNDNWTATVSEGAFRGTPVLHVRAEDSDSFDNGEGRLTYKLLKQIYPCQSKLNKNNQSHGIVEDTDFFRLDEQSGMLSLTDIIDREKHECFSVLISVEDFGTPPQSETQWFEINIQDQDDNFPSLPKEMRNIELVLNETTTTGRSVLNFTALDLDIYPNNRVDFEITSTGLATEYFKIAPLDEDGDEQSTSVVLSGNLKKLEPDEVTFVVKCYPKNKKYSSGNTDCASKVHVSIIRDSESDSELEHSKISEVILGAASGIPVGNLIGNVGFPHSKRKIETSIQMFHPTSVAQAPYNVSEIVKVDSNTGDIFVWDNLDAYQDGHLRVLVSQRESTNRMTQKKLKIFITSNTHLLMSDTSDYPKVQKLMHEIETYLNIPRQNSRMNRGVFKLLTFDQSNAPEGKTKICFQLLENENLVSQEKALQLLNSPDVLDIFLKFSFSDEIHKGCPQQIRTPAKLVVRSSTGSFWVERSLVGISSVCVIATLSAILILCLVNRSRGKDEE